MPGKHWTEEEIEELHRLVEIGLSYKQIAECLNRSYRSLRAHCSRLGISNSKESRIRSFFDSAPDECLTLDDVKVKFDVGQTWAYEIMNRMVSDGTLRLNDGLYERRERA